MHRSPSEGVPAARRSATVAGNAGHTLLISMALNAGVPLGLYALLSPRLSTLHTVLLIALVPLIENIVTLVRHRRADAFGLAVLASLLVAASIVVVGGSPRLILAREQMVTGAIGVALILSLLLPRPALFYVFRPLLTRQDPIKKAPFDAQWATAAFRDFLRRVTLVFGLIAVAEAIVNVYLAFTLTIPTFLAVSPIVRYGIFGGLVGWFALYVRRVTRVTGSSPLRISQE